MKFDPVVKNEILPFKTNPNNILRFVFMKYMRNLTFFYSEDRYIKCVIKTYFREIRTHLNIFQKGITNFYIITSVYAFFKKISQAHPSRPFGIRKYIHMLILSARYTLHIYTRLMSMDSDLYFKKWKGKEKKFFTSTKC